MWMPLWLSVNLAGCFAMHGYESNISPTVSGWDEAGKTLPCRDISGYYAYEGEVSSVSVARRARYDIRRDDPTVAFGPLLRHRPKPLARSDSFFGLMAEPRLGTLTIQYFDRDGVEWTGVSEVDRTFQFNCKEGSVLVDLSGSPSNADGSSQISLSVDWLDLRLREPDELIVRRETTTFTQSLISPHMTVRNVVFIVFKATDRRPESVSQ